MLVHWDSVVGYLDVLHEHVIIILVITGCRNWMVYILFDPVNSKNTQKMDNQATVHKDQALYLGQISPIPYIMMK